LKNPAGSVRFGFGFIKKNRTEPKPTKNQKKNRAKPKKTKPKPEKPSQNRENRAKTGKPEPNRFEPVFA
jgi:hypothetical protein